MNEEHSKSKSNAKQQDHAAQLCEELKRTIWGHNNTPGLMTQVELLRHQVDRIELRLQQQNAEDLELSTHKKTLHMSILERVAMWVVVGVLTLAVIGTQALIQHRIEDAVRDALQSVTVEAEHAGEQAEKRE